jgi:hypothetical protein
MFIEAAIRSIRAQTAADRVRFQIIVGIDRGATVPASLADDPGVQIAESNGGTQAAALNAAATLVEGEFVAFLEDDDLWDPHFVQAAFAALELKGFAFLSSSQLEMAETDQPLRVQDFPIMSGWLMPRKTWDSVGVFDESYRWHLDNEWLGRLAVRAVPRCHLVEATVPKDRAAIAADRPALEALRKHSLGQVELVQHSLSWPLVFRFVHSGSGLAQIRTDVATKSESNQEYQRLIRDYGRLPW